LEEAVLRRAFGLAMAETAAEAADTKEVVVLVPGAIGSGQAARKAAENANAATDDEPRLRFMASPATRTWVTAFVVHMVYALLGTIGYSVLEEDWNIIDSFYFTFTSI
jgi:hypothetical protein